MSYNNMKYNTIAFNVMQHHALPFNTYIAMSYNSVKYYMKQQ